MPTLSEYKQLLAQPVVPDELLAALAADPRAGAKQLLSSYQRKLQAAAAAKAAVQARSRYERELWATTPLVAGVDEVGRGPLAGPVVTAAVILPVGSQLDVNDSKQLTAHHREVVYPQILSEAVAVAIGVADHRMIDRENIYHATELAMRQAVMGLQVAPQHLLVDAMHVPVNLPQTKLIKGDANSISIAAASIVAKVVRDKLMTMYALVYPGYDFEHNMGYGTKAHLAGLEALGPCPIHRRSFSPVQAAMR